VGATSRRVTLQDIREAADGIAGVAVRTPLRELAALSDVAGFPVYLKLENLQPTGAFKLRGAWTFARRLPPETRGHGFITYSSGNHGQAVAFVAQRLGTRAVVVMPETVPALKIDGVRRWGGEVRFAGTTSEDRLERAMEMATAEGLTVIPPYDHPDIIAGQGTVGLEIMEDLPEVAHVVVPVGGGGLIAGITTALKTLRAKTRVTGVEPEGGAALQAALQAGVPVRLERTASIADGLLPLSVGTVTFSHLKDRVDAVTVSDRAIANATVWLHQEGGILAEPSGAATTAALREGTIDPEGPIALVVSGGNVDPDSLQTLAKG
jgi:threonine dehydratase